MENKKCTKCEKIKNTDEFYISKSTKDKLTYVCIDCQSLRMKEYYIENRKKLIQENIDNIYLKKYNFSRNDFNNLLLEQENKCKICDEEFKNSKSTHIDHNHETGEIRGLLCHQCNVGIGMFKDNIQNLENAIEYLKKFETVEV